MITKGPLNPSVAQVATLFYSSAREGFADFLRQYDLDDSSGAVLLPAYIGWSPREGSGVLDPVVEQGRSHGFYELHDDLTVDIHDLGRRLRSGRFRVVVIIHYYGRIEPRMTQIAEMTAAYGAVLIEDLAHGFFSSQLGGGGQHGKICLFSLHKMLPLTDGGMIVYRDPRLIKLQCETRPELARKILEYDWPSITRLRRRNFLGLSERLRSLSEHGAQFELLWPELGAHEVPQTLPVRIFNADRDAVYRSMNNAGYGMVSLYHTLVAEIGTFQPSMQNLSNQIINFPVHQDVETPQLDSLVQAFAKALKKHGA